MHHPFPRRQHTRYRKNEVSCFRVRDIRLLWENFPIVYFCTSQRTGTDIEWCCAFLKRVIWETFMVQFSPQFIMTDADNAQFNACVAQLPHSKILMCWFHVCQNVKARIEKAALAPVTIAMIWRDLNILHYSRKEEEFLVRRSRVLAAWASASDSCPPFKVVADYIIAQWILHPRFSCWQAYHTPPGCATTNNPLEQYHKTLKLVNMSKRATPTEMVDRLDRSRLVFVHMHKTFSSTHSVSERLKALYNLTVRRKELRAAPLPSAGDLPVHLVQVRHRPRTSYADKESEPADDFYVEDPKKSQTPYKSIHVLKMQWQDMPRDGWLVDARLRSCSCRFNMEFGICTHVIHATRELSLHCPGMPAPVSVFVSNQRQTGTITQSSRWPGSGRQVDGNSHQESSDGRVCPAETNGDPAAHYPEQGPQARPPSDDTSHHLGTFHGLPVLGPQPRSPPPVFIEHHIDTESGIREDLESTTAPADMELFRLTPIEAEIRSYEAMLLREREMRSESLSEIRTAYQGANGYQRSYSDSVLHTINVASNYGAAPMNRASSARAPLQVATINAEIASTQSFGSISSSRQSCEQTKRRRC